MSALVEGSVTIPGWMAMSMLGGTKSSESTTSWKEEEAGSIGGARIRAHWTWTSPAELRETMPSVTGASGSLEV